MIIMILRRKKKIGTQTLTQKIGTQAVMRAGTQAKIGTQAVTRAGTQAKIGTQAPTQAGATREGGESDDQATQTDCFRLLLCHLKT